MVKNPYYYLPFNLKSYPIDKKKSGGILLYTLWDMKGNYTRPSFRLAKKWPWQSFVYSIGYYSIGRTMPVLSNSIQWRLTMMHIFKIVVFGWFKFTLKPHSIAHDKLQMAIWDTSFWTFIVKFGHMGPKDIS